MSRISTRVLSSDDWRLWRELRLAALAEAPYAFGSTLASWQGRGDSELRWRARLDAVPFNVVAEREHEPVAMASCTLESASVDAELLSMWVAPSARGTGVGDHLVAEVADWAGRRGRERLMLRVYASNTRAIAFYRRNRFVDAGVVRARSAGREDELELALSLCHAPLE